MMLAAAIKGIESFPLNRWDYTAFIVYFAIVLGIGLWVGRRKKTGSDDYFLAGRSLPWYVVGSSFIGSNISAEHFIGMIGSAMIFGICPAMSEWGNVASFTLLIWFFIPFLLASQVFTTPEYMERRFNPALRQFFAQDVAIPVPIHSELQQKVPVVTAVRQMVRMSGFTCGRCGRPAARAAAKISWARRRAQRYCP